MLEEYQEARQKMYDRIAHITSLLDEHCLEPEQYNSLAVSCGHIQSVDLSWCGTKIEAHWLYQEPYEDWDHESILRVPIKLFENGTDIDILTYYTNKVKEEDLLHSKRQLITLLNEVGALRYNPHYGKLDIERLLCEAYQGGDINKLAEEL